MKNILSIENISLTYQTLTNEICAIDNLSFTVEENQFVSIIGPSGCGKTTILSIIAKLIKPTKGKIKFFDDKCDIGYMLQKDQLFPWRTVEKNIFLPLEIKKKLSKENIDYAYTLLKKYNIYEFKDSYPEQLSGGMRQRVALIRTLVFNPSILLLDEPFSALDYQTRLNVCDDVYSIIKSEKKSTILVTHDISEAIAMSDKIIVLTNRPSKVKTIFYPTISGNSPLTKRESKDFSIMFEQIYKELNL